MLMGNGPRERKAEVQKTERLVDKVRDLEQAECAVIQSPSHLDAAAHTHLEVTPGSDCQPHSLSYYPQDASHPGSPSDPSRNVAVTHIILR